MPRRIKAGRVKADGGVSLHNGSMERVFPQGDGQRESEGRAGLRSLLRGSNRCAGMECAVMNAFALMCGDS